jgi:hypothetical protein
LPVIDARAAGSLLAVALCLLPGLPACLQAEPQAPVAEWHRFPVGAATRLEPTLAVIYSSDNVGPTTTLARLGYPDRLLFRLHQDHPQLKVMLTSCPANRYSGERRLSDSPEATATWKSIALDPNFEWIDLAGLGYSHSPPDDRNLDHHEFSVKEGGCNIDHSTLGRTEYTRRQMGQARNAYRTAGIPDDRVVAMRFPGMESSPAALEAALGAGFLAVLDAGNDEEPGREWWTPLQGDEEILHIRNANVLRSFARSQPLEEGLLSGRITPANIRASAEFEAAVARGLHLVSQVETTGGLLHLMDQWAETFREVGGTRPRYLVVDAVLDGIEARYGPRAWYPGSRELILWLDALRHGKVSGKQEGSAVMVRVEPPASWARRGLSGLDDVSVRVALPDQARLEDVTIDDGSQGWKPLAPSSWWMSDGEAWVLFPLHGPVQLRIRFTRA